MFHDQYQDDMDYEFNARYDYIKELEAEHYDPCSDPANACYDGYEGATPEEAENEAAKYRLRKAGLLPWPKVETPWLDVEDDGLPF